MVRATGAFGEYIHTVFVALGRFSFSSLDLALLVEGVDEVVVDVDCPNRVVALAGRRLDVVAEHGDEFFDPYEPGVEVDVGSSEVTSSPIRSPDPNRNAQSGRSRSP